MTNSKSILATLGLLLASSLAFGQTALVETTLSAALTTSNTFVTVGSVTGMVANQTVLFIEDGSASAKQGGEALMVVNVPATGTKVQVTRGYDQTIPNGHISGAPVIYGPANAFQETEPSGACTLTNQPFTPYINLKTGNQWLCSTVTNSWVPGFFNVDAPAGVSTAVASVAGATLPSGPLFHVTGALAITAWGSSTTVGMLGGAGSKTDVVGAPFCTIPDAAFTWTATNNITVAGTAVIGVPICWIFDQTNKKYIALQGK
jgi:hypothetical protein